MGVGKESSDKDRPACLSVVAGKGSTSYQLKEVREQGILADANCLSAAWQKQYLYIE